MEFVFAQRHGKKKVTEHFMNRKECVVKLNIKIKSFSQSLTFTAACMTANREPKKLEDVKTWSAYNGKLARASE